jgi:hypothetical protein
MVLPTKNSDIAVTILANLQQHLGHAVQALIGRDMKLTLRDVIANHHAYKRAYKPSREQAYLGIGRCPLRAPCRQIP